MSAIPWEVNHCDICGQDSLCTPSNDFYGGGLVPDGQIACESCFRKLLHAHMRETNR